MSDFTGEYNAETRKFSAKIPKKSAKNRCLKYTNFDHFVVKSTFCFKISGKKILNTKNIRTKIRIKR